MYSPTTRLLTVLELLQSYQQMSGPEIARRLEIDVRTVRRYIVMLQDMGFPVEAERGPYGAYQLQRGHRLPPLMFTDAEAVAITLGLLAMREFRFPVDVASVEGALAKTERVMPEKPLQQVRSLQEAIIFNTTPPPSLLHNDFIVVLSSAVQQCQQIHMRYLSWNGDASKRDFDPYGIVFNEGYWYTAGYCHLRQDLRTFRLDRIISLEVQEQSFVRPKHFDVLSHVLHSIAFGASAYQVEVILQISMDEAQKVIHPIMGTLEETDKGIIFRRASAQLEWIAHVLIGLDFPVFVVQPVELRTVLAQMAAKALRMAGEEVVRTGEQY